MTTPSWAKRAFSAFSIPNFRLWFFGQTLSVSGQWMQRIAQSWLVLELTGSGTALGLVVAVQFLPILLFAPLGGLVADRFNNRRLIFATQVSAAVVAIILGLLVVTNTVELWMVYVLAAALGLIASVDTPTRQTFVLELVDRGHLKSAVSLNSVLVNLARIIGPAFAALLIATVGLGVCFLVNGITYFGVIGALLLMDLDELHVAPSQPRNKRQLREGLAYVRVTPTVLVPLLMMLAIGTFAFEFQVILPLFARFTFGGDATTYATMTSFMGAGAMVGGLVTASRRSRPPVALAKVAALFGLVHLALAFAPTLAMAYAAITVLGGVAVGFIALGNTTVQLAAAPEMRGRVMGLWVVAFLGSTPVGGPVIGWIGEHLGPRVGIGVGAIATLITAAVAYRILDRFEMAPDEEARRLGPSAKLG